MFVAYCPRHGFQSLYGASSIEAIHNTDLGIEVVLRCSCGERIEVLTGRDQALAR